MRQLKITKQITNRDSESLKSYLAEVSNIPMLTPEEEQLITKNIKEGDKRAMDRLVNANLRFVISVAKQYNGKAPLLDLINEGNIGLIKAAERFDETRGFKFISYAVWWIRQAIMQYLSDHQRMVRLPLNKLGSVNKINQAKAELEQVLDRQPTTSEIAEYLTEYESLKKNGDPSKYSEVKVKFLLEQSQGVSSLDAPMTSESDSGTMLDLMPGENEHDIKHVLKNKDLQVELKRILNTLTYRERSVVISYFSLFGEPQKSLEEIGMDFDLTRERVRQIKEKALKKLKHRVGRTSLKEYR
jgi:RNA polymerase primary sigma factor